MKSKFRIVIPTVERPGQAEDLSVLLMSLSAYAPEIPVSIYHQGPLDVEMEGVTLVPQHPNNRHFGDACQQIVEEAEGDEVLIFLNDDTVVTPDTIQTLISEWKALTKSGIYVGVLGCRSNMIAGPQNIRSANGATKLDLRFDTEDKILEVDVVFGVAFMVSVAALRSIPNDWTNLHWYSDNLLSFDMKKAHRRNFISTSYCHHIGSRSGKDYSRYQREALKWLWAKRPDAAQVFDPNGVFKPEEK